MKPERLLLLSAAVALLATSVPAADRPDLSGSWALDAASSDFGPAPVPGGLVLTIRMQGASFDVTQTGGGGPELVLHFDTSGQQVTNEIPGAKMTSTHRWEGDALVGEIRIAAEDGMALLFKDRISCSRDGKVMTLTRDIDGPNGAARMKMVMNRK